MINSPEWTKPTINTTYPPNNFVEFERWFGNRYAPLHKREYLDIYWTAYYVNNNYGQNKEAINRLQDYLNGLDTSKKYFTCVQYDDGILNDVSHLDLLQFNMSKNIGYPLPLLGQPHPYDFNEPKEYFANFIGNKTHPIRNEIESLRNKQGYYISFEQHNAEEYCRVMHKSLFTLCPRGYGINSFRICEALQYGSIPVIITDELLQPHNIPFNSYGVVIAAGIDIEIYLSEISPLEILNKQENLKSIYEKMYTYESTYQLICNKLNET